MFSKKKEALPISSLTTVKAARSPKGLYFVRLVFKSRNLDMEAADETAFEELRWVELGFCKKRLI